jgi:polyisoprenyl-teichoic acid--peptidoglycan teichoic acid transferase
MGTGPRTGRKRKIRWKRAALWGVVALIVIALGAGGGFYLWFRAQVGAANARVGQDVIQALGEGTSSTTAATGAATTSTSIADPTGMNIVLLGSDTRASSGEGGRSDTIILIHVDSKKGYLSLLSIPRDLYVSIPGHDKNKINTSYNFGGPALVIRTIKSAFSISIDHYVEVDFKAFEQITNTLGGVYVDVDRTYDDGSIQFAPGYQLLDGLNALRYVRTRHDTNYDFGRMERQQRFINALREQAMGWNLPLKLPGLIKDLFGNVDTDLTANEFLKLAYWAVKLDSTRMRQAKIVGSVQTINGASVVVATDAALKGAITDFLTEPPAVEEDEALTPPANANIKTADLSGISLNVVNGTGRVGQGALAAVWLMRQGATVLSIKESEDPVEGNAVVTYPRSQEDNAEAVAGALGIPMAKQSGKSSRIMVTLGKAYGISGSQIPAATATSGTVVDAEQWQSLAGQASFPLVAPTFIPNGVTYSFKRSYSIAAGGKDQPAVRVGYQFGSRDKYMGFSETTWVDAPIASPGWKVKGPGGVIYRLVGTSIKTDHIWWQQDGVLCWVSNTIVFDLRREEMLAAAMSALPVTAAQPAATTSTTARTTATEATTTTTATSSTTTKTEATTTSASTSTTDD